MALTPILAPGITAALSDPIVLADNTSVNIAIYGAAGAALPIPMAFTVEFTTPDAPAVVERLDMLRQTISVTGPGTFNVRRPAYVGDPFGVCVHDNA